MLDLKFKLPVLFCWEIKFSPYNFENLLESGSKIFVDPNLLKYFDFSNQQFWEKISGLLNEFTEDPKLRKLNGNRGSKHFIYINRTFFGLYHLLHDLNAKIETDSYQKYI